MTKELKLEECVNLLSGTASTGAAISSTSSSGAHHHHHHHLHHNKPLSLLPPSPYVSGSSGTSPGRDQNSTYAGQNLITSTPRAMIRRNSKNHLTGGYQCTVRLLDDAEILQCEFQPHHKGQFIMDFVCRQLNIAEKDYFGLRYVDTNKQRHWLDLSKSIVKQLRDMAYIVCFRFKFYPNDPMLLKEEVSRYQLVLQLRRDILHGRLYSTLSDMATLASFIIQSELGDHDPEVHTGNYISDYELVSRQSHELEEKAMELHQKLKGLTPSEADILFLKKAATLDTYGIDPHPVKDQQGEQVYLGINHTGISTFQGSRKSTHFKWSQITKLNYEAKMFIIHLSIPEDARTKKKETVGFKCQTSSSCKYLWRSAVEQRLFFT
ncbi:unnamed protein product [Orchesella dallaii]|uniref:Moesin/ezrin/radixin homolog 1 n=1 Tax=Orchesella dallaii TaxID=48710 RepID=A0ABP1RXU5_9HEXA